MLSLEDLKKYIGEVPLEDNELRFLLDAYVEKVGSMIGKELLLNAYQETLKGDGNQCLYLTATPIFDILDISTSEEGQLAENQYFNIGNQLYKADGAWTGKYTSVGMSNIKYSALENVIVTYRAGYLTVDTLAKLEENGEDVEGIEPNFPSDLELLIYESIKNHIRNDGQELKAYAIDDIKYEYITTAESFALVIDKYRGEL